MATASDVTLSTDDSTGTSVFKPLIKEAGRVEYVARNSLLAAATRKLIALFRPETNTRKTQRLNLSIAMPLLRSVGDPAVYSADDVARVNLEWVFPVSMSLAERQELGYMLRDLVNESAIKAAYEDLDPPV